MSASPLAHFPVYPVKPTHFGELAFLRKWNDLMRPERRLVFVNDPQDHADKSNLAFILQNYLVKYEISQREATIAASLIGWLGSITGQRLIYKAADVSRRLGFSLSEAYLATWSLLNTRNADHSPHRRLEIIMQSRKQRHSGEFPDLQAHDYELAEHLMMWLGSRLGRNFVLVACEYMKVVEKEYMLQELSKAGMTDGPVVRQTQEQIRQIQENPTLIFANSSLADESLNLFEQPRAGKDKPSNQLLIDFDVFS